ncbi:MAG: NAD(P)H-hydrate dehydratase [Deltaproteobacteria bacterium]|nr:NAD(P)H-hydrate dehydratase [Deltaproteobacteria bacterium]
MFRLTAQHSRQLDRFSENLCVNSEELLQNAGRGVARELMRVAKASEGPVVFFIGKGNNGGDGKVAADILLKRKYKIVLIPVEADLKKYSPQIEGAGWLVDALLGVGLKGETQGWVREAIAVMNRSQKRILSIDIPSGLSADKGIPLGAAVKATMTVCLGGVKLGCFVHPGVEYAGKIVAADIGIPKEAWQKISFHAQSTEPEHFKSFLKKRPLGSHKGDFGHLLVVAGSKAMPGAGFLASQAALRAGAGLVTYALPEGAYQKFDPKHAEVMVQAVPDNGAGYFVPESAAAVLKNCEKKRAVVLGPGLGRNPETIAFVQSVAAKIDLPLVLDADGLFCVSNSPRLLNNRKAPTLLTPHLGEMAQLLGWQTGEVDRAKIQASLDAAREWNAIVILKGYRSLIALPQGNLFVNPTGNPGMATAGMGDVLSGVLGGLLAQGLPPDKAALAGVYLHGLAGDRVAEEEGQTGLIASDVARMLPKAIRRVEQSA